MKLKDCFDKGLLRNNRFPPEVIDKEIVNANKHLENASKCIDTGMYDLAVVSVYTAMFHAARAILFKDGIKERSHVCLIAYLRSKYPILTEYINILDNYRRTRHTALYGIDEEMNADDAIYGLEHAKKFIKVIREEILNL